MISKLSIGTAQLGENYGVSNLAGSVSVSEGSEILSAAWKAGVRCLDTAPAYGDAEAKLGMIGVSSWSVSSKLPPLPGDIRNSEVLTWVTERVATSLRRLQISSLSLLLLHRPSDLLGPEGAWLKNAILQLKDDGLVGSVGFSIYSPDELEDLTTKIWPDVVQAPFNVFDTRMQSSGWLDRLVEEGSVFHARSVFLQGVLLMEPPPPFFVNWTELFNRWRQICLEGVGSPAQLALSVVLGNAQVDKVVVGVESKIQLQELLSAGDILAPDISELAVDDVNLLDPSKWLLG